MFDALVILYLFLGGTGASLGGFLAVFGLWQLARNAGPGRPPRRWRLGATRGEQRFFGFGNLIAAAVCLLGAVCLLFDMERPDKVIVLLTSPNTSVVAMGAYALGLSTLLSLILGILWLRRERVPRALFAALSVLQVAAACVTMTYTALLLMGFKGVAFFQTWSLVGLFFCSSASCGLALCAQIGMAVRVVGFEAGSPFLSVFELVAAAAEALFLVLFAAHAAQVAPEALASLAGGAFAVPFWVGVVGCGIAVPLAAWALPRFVRGYRLHGGLAPALVMLSGLVLRWCVVAVV